MEPEKKQYINGVFIKKHTFNDGGSILKTGIRVEELMAQLMPLRNKDGFVNVIIAERRTPSAGGVTHCVYLDTYKPKSTQGQEEHSRAQANAYQPQPRDEDDRPPIQDDIPF